MTDFIRAALREFAEHIVDRRSSHETIRGGTPLPNEVAEVSPETMLGAGMSLDEVLRWAARAEASVEDSEPEDTTPTMIRVG
jgi:hypothetical protein